MSNKIKVLIIDDHQIFRDGILSMFSEVDDIEITGVASDGEEALEKMELLMPDVLLLDISMPKLGGLELLTILNKKYPDSKVIVLSMHTKDEYIYKAVNAGAYGYLPKQNTSKDELLNAIRTVHKGEEYLNEAVIQVMQKSHILKNTTGIDFHKKYNTLTKREREIVRLVAEGLSNQEIAGKLFVNIRTVETHKTNILQKLNLKNSVDLVKFAIKNNLLEL
ncbi:MAG: response regulator transcription factor [Bacteroidales bacterium]